MKGLAPVCTFICCSSSFSLLIFLPQVGQINSLLFSFFFLPGFLREDFASSFVALVFCFFFGSLSPFAVAAATVAIFRREDKGEDDDEEEEDERVGSFRFLPLDDLVVTDVELIENLGLLWSLWQDLVGSFEVEMVS